MADRELRERERAARAGDVDTRLAHGLARLRAGDPEALLALLEAEPVEGGEALERAVSPQQVAQVCGLLLERLVARRRATPTPPWDRQHIRLRPAMYIGDTGPRGVSQLLELALERPLDEAESGRCGVIEVVGRGGDVSVEMPSSVDPLPALLIALEKPPPSWWRGHDFGLKVVDALSAEHELEISRGGASWRVRRSRGEPVDGPTWTGPAARIGARVRYRADPTLFACTALDRAKVAERLRVLSALVPGLRFIWRDDADAVRDIRCPNGLGDLLPSRVGEPEARFALRTRSELPPLCLDLVVAPCAGSIDRSVVSFVNRDPTEGGTHVEGLEAGLLDGLRAWQSRSPGVGLDAGQLAAGLSRTLVAAVAVTLPEPQYRGATRAWLGNAEVSQAVRGLVAEPFCAWLTAHPDLAEAWVRRATGAG